MAAKKVAKAMKLSELRLFHLSWLMLLPPGAVLVLTIKKGDILLWLNENHSEMLDGAFLFLNGLGEPLFIAILGVFLMAIRLGNFISYVFVIAVSSMLIQFLKRIVFGPLPRPVSFFGDKVDLHQVGSHELLGYFSFPSGHAAISFAVFSMSCFLIADKRWQFFALILALGAALARVYLNQHFFQDIYFGSMVGVASSVLAFRSGKFIEGKLNSETKNYSLIKRIFKRVG